MKNPYFTKAHIAKESMELLIEGFAQDRDASDMYFTCGVSYKTMKAIYQRIRINICEFGWIYEDVKKKSILINEIHEEQIYGICIEGKKITILPAEKGDDIQYVLVPSHAEFIESIVVGIDTHLRIHSKMFAENSQQKNLIDNFWAFTQSRLRKFYGIPKETYFLHLRESQFRFNLRSEDLYAKLLQLLREYPL